MATGRIIRLDDLDDVTSVRARLAYAYAERAALVLPANAGSWRSVVALDRVRRAGVQLGIEVAIVSRDAAARSAAAEAGMPAFGSVDRAVTAQWLAPDDFAPVARTRAPRRFVVNSLKRFFPARAWFATFAGVILAAVALLALASLSIVLLPSATVTLTSASRAVTTIVPVTLDTRATSVDIPNRTVPAQRVDSYIEGSLSVPTTGRKDVASGVARGTVTFFSIVPQTYVVPRGTVVSTSGGNAPVRFITLAAVEVPPGGRASASVEALAEGAPGNVEANQVNQVEGVPSIAVTVANPGAITGGGGNTVPAVSAADYARARSTLLAQLTRQSVEKLQNEAVVKRDALYVVPASITIRDIQNEAYDRFVGEAANELRLDMRLQLVALAVSPANLSQVAQAALLRKVPKGFDLVDFETDRGDEAEEGVGTRSEFFITARGRATAKIDPQQVRMLVRGKTPAEAQNALVNDLLLQRRPVIELGPSWLLPYYNRLPLTPVRIDTRIVALDNP